MSEETTPEAPAAPQPTKFQAALAQFKGTVPAEPPPAPPAPAPNTDLVAAREQAAFLQGQRALMAEKKAREAAEAKAKGYEALESKDAKATLKLLKDRGLTMEMLAKAGLDDDDEPQETPEARKIRELEERLTAKEREDSERATASVHQQNVTALAGLLKAQAEKFPALSGFERAPNVLADRWAAHVAEHGEPDDPAEQAAIVTQLAEAFNTAVTNDVASILSSDHALKAYLTREDVKDRALTLLGVKQSAGPASEKGIVRGKGAPGIPATASAEGAVRKTSPQTHKDKYAAALGSFKNGRG